MKPLRATCLLALWCGACATSPPSTDGWRLVWSDEFDRDGAPDPAKWSYEEGRIRNDEAQTYTVDRRENARVEGGRLVLEARREALGGAGYTSASLHTKGVAEWTHARIEVRARLPHGRGLWPAIWLLGADWHETGWPACGEIDVMEFVGFEPDVLHQNVHTRDFNHMRGNGRGTRIPFPGASEDFHVHAVEWDGERMRFSIDGKPTFEVTNDHTGAGSWPFDHPFFLLLNVAVGGSWGGQRGIDETVFPQRMEIDWVRVSVRP